MKRGGLVALVAVLGLALGTGVASAQDAPPAVEPQTSLADIEDEVMCPICGVTLELATEAPQAEQEREFIRELIAQGLTKDEIKDRLVDEFGSEVLAIPEGSGFDLAAWLVPGLAIVVAGGAIFVGLRRWRAAGGAGARSADEDPARPGSANGSVSAEDAERLEQDLSRYDL